MSSLVPLGGAGLSGLVLSQAPIGSAALDVTAKVARIFTNCSVPSIKRTRSNDFRETSVKIQTAANLCEVNPLRKYFITNRAQTNPIRTTCVALPIFRPWSNHAGISCSQEMVKIGKAVRLGHCQIKLWPKPHSFSVADHGKQTKDSGELLHAFACLRASTHLGLKVSGRQRIAAFLKEPVVCDDHGPFLLPLALDV